VATWELDFKVLEPITASEWLAKSDDDAEGKGIAANAGEVISEQVRRSFGLAGGRNPDHLDVVAFPVHLLASRDVSRDARQGGEIGDGETEAPVGGHRAAEREGGFVTVGRSLSPPVPGRRLRIRADSATVVLDRRPGNGEVIIRVASLTLTSLHDGQRARST
jgi:hypothetical protein